MKRIITYSLLSEAEDSDRYYADISAFTYEWTQRALPRLATWVEGFRAERRLRHLPGRPPESCAFDLLVIGVLLREHRDEINQISGAGVFLLNGLINFQERYPKTEGFIKLIRGAYYGLMLTRRKEGKDGNSRLKKLITWLRANGDGTQADRLDEWKLYFESNGNQKEAIHHALNMADDFFVESMKAIGKYTQQVDRFLQSEASRHRWRYDLTFVNRSRLEYHMAMVGNEILNAANRKTFQDTRHKVVILPPCMRAQAEKDCKAKATGLGERCAGCTPSCRIHQVTKLGEKHGFDVYIIPEELRVFRNGADEESPGVIGVSCVLTNWSGGWDIERLGIPAQGLLLDYVGCKYHWDEVGFPTDTNIHRLKSILKLD